MSIALLTTKRFAPLFWCQFLSAFNDNVLRNAVVILILFHLQVAGADTYVTLVGAALIGPYLLFSAIGGQIADRYDKARVAQRLKLFEISTALLAAGGFLLPSLPLLFAALVAFGTFGALFGPVKYGILPDHLAREELGSGNALIEGATFLAILLGTVVGGLAITDDKPVGLVVFMLVVAVGCYGTSRMIPATRAAAPDSAIDPNILASTGRLLHELWSDTRLWRCAVTTSLFWAIGSIMLSLLAPLVTHVLHGAQLVVTVDLAVFAIAIAVGSGLAAWVCGGRILLLPTLLGTLILAAASLDLGLWLQAMPASADTALLGPAAFFRQAAGWRSTLDLAFVAIGGGLMIVPSFAAVQAWADPARRARAVAGVNILNAVFMVASSVIVAGLQAGGVALPTLFTGVGVFALLCAVWIGWTLPTSAFRDALAMIFNIVYRLRVEGLDNLDKAGPNPIIALNHVSFLDAAAALAVLPKDPVFAIDAAIAQRWWVKPFLRFTRAMPLDPTKPLATRSLINASREGDTIVIFPEGRLTVTGSLMKVYDGAGLIADKTGTAVVPVRIQGLESTVFSRLRPDQVRRRWFPPVIVTLLEPVHLHVDEALKGRARRRAAGAALYDVMSDLIFHTEPIDRTLVEAMVDAGNSQGWSRIAVEDPIAGALSYRKLMIGVRVLARKIVPMAPPGAAIGVMLPSATGTAVTFLAVNSAGRVPAMINFTAGATAVIAACRAAEVTTVLTSRAFIEKARLEKLTEALAPVLRIVYLDDVRAAISGLDKLRGVLGHRRALVPRKASDPAAILFTSGSEGSPKGVALSHRGMLSNAAQAAARIDFGRSDLVFNVLPMFHAFGLTVGLILPVVSGVRVYLYPSPLHYRLVPELIYTTNATILFGTDTFLAGYARSANPYDLRSLRYVMAGAEPVKEATRRVWAEKFGLRILEGYGITEASPAVALNTPMFNKFGSVGRVLPGIASRLEAVPGIDEGGRLFISGPNVMLGYLKDDKPGVLQPPEEGWHDTGDIVTIDPEGYVTIKGRAKRFAKIGGEMISLAAVEALAGALWPNNQTAVVAAPDARKGERLVMVTDQAEATRAAFGTYAKAHGASDLMLPAEVVVTEALPLLGSGKVDLVTLARTIRERQEAASAAA